MLGWCRAARPSAESLPNVGFEPETRERRVQGTGHTGAYVRGARTRLVSGGYRVQGTRGLTAVGALPETREQTNQRSDAAAGPDSRARGEGTALVAGLGMTRSIGYRVQGGDAAAGPEERAQLWSRVWSCPGLITIEGRAGVEDTGYRVRGTGCMVSSPLKAEPAWNCVTDTTRGSTGSATYLLTYLLTYH